MGKGDKQRPRGVSREAFDQNWENTFGRPKVYHAHKWERDDYTDTYVCSCGLHTEKPGLFNE